MKSSLIAKVTKAQNFASGEISLSLIPLVVIIAQLYSLYTFQEGVHLKLQPFVCEYCQRPFSLRGNMKAVS